MQETVVRREPGKAIPEAFRNLLVEKHPTGFGFVAPHPDTSHTQVFSGDEDNLLDALNKVEETYKDVSVVYHFVEASAEEFNYESFQPFNLITKPIEGQDDEVHLSVMVEGSFPNHEKNEDGESFSSPYLFVHNFLGPLVKELNEVADGDLKVLMGLLKNKTQKDKISAAIGDKGSVWFIPCEGEQVLHAKGGNPGTWDWGFATQDLGYKTVLVGTTVPVTGKPPSMREQAEARRRIQAAAEPKPEAPVPPPEKEKKPEHPEGGAPIIALSEAEKTKKLLGNPAFYLSKAGTMMARPAPGTDWKASRTWWNRHANGPIPKDANLVYQGTTIDKLREDSPLLALYNKIMADGNKPKEAENEQADNGKPEEQEHENKPKGYTLVIPQNLRANFVGMRKNNKLLSCTREEALEALEKWPPASAQLGVEFKELVYYAPETLLRIAHIGGAMSAALLNEFRCAYLDLIESAKGVETKTEVAGPTKPLTMKEQAEARRKKVA